MNKNHLLVKELNAKPSGTLKRVPKWYLQMHKITTKDFKIQKRQELKDIKQAMKIYNLGSAHAPGFHLYIEMEKYFRELETALSVKNWGR